MKYLKAFIIGSSFFVFAPFFYIVEQFLLVKNYSYFTYTMTAPLYFGVWNVLSLIIADKMGLSLTERFMLVSLLAALNIAIYAKITKKYNFTEREWIDYYILIFALHVIIWNTIIYGLEKMCN